MDVRELIDQKKQQIAKLQAQIEVLEELAGELGATRTRRGGGRRTGAAGRRRGSRAGRGANQQRVLSVLGGSPMRAKDIAAAAGLPTGAANQVLIGLRKRGRVEKVGRGLYRAARSGASPSEARAPRAARRGRGAGTQPRHSAKVRRGRRRGSR